jgi:hypothetical protein
MITRKINFEPYFSEHVLLILHDALQTKYYNAWLGNSKLNLRDKKVVAAHVLKILL